MEETSKERVHGFTSVIQEFLSKRLEDKIKPLKGTLETETDPEKLEKAQKKHDDLLEKYVFFNWLDSAANRVSGIKIVTHTIKATHTSAKGTSLFCLPSALTQLDEVGTCHINDAELALDVVGNAAYLDVYSFLRQTYKDKTLLEWMEDDDPDLFTALGGNEQARDWMTSFTNIRNITDEISSHTLSKQVYWLTGETPQNDEDFHLLSPLFSSALAHRIYTTVNNHRFGDAAVEARKARKDKQHSEHTLHEYYNIAIRKIGGTKPQNVSQLNSECGGRNYLLASFPPTWQTRDVYVPLGKKSFFEIFSRRPEASAVVDELRKFLEADPPPNMHTRNRRDALVEHIIGELIIYAGELHSLEPCWSKHKHCHLKDEEVILLDPRRIEHDAEFAERIESAGTLANWVPLVAKQFALWLNAELGQKLLLGDDEHTLWASFLKDTLSFPHTIKSHIQEAPNA